MYAGTSVCVGRSIPAGVSERPVTLAFLVKDRGAKSVVVLDPLGRVQVKRVSIMCFSAGKKKTMPEELVRLLGWNCSSDAKETCSGQRA